ncbi:Uncharacterized protein DAT39_005585 [Clarias magur]|uniref:Uncharacterized protein n=1 Tax=Clarias magur TaxID=1594786 RepID=A0A8J4UE60_CLAMG|nr:Uncharacterized protein DAT39_005585 [Clarias magur]
MASSQARCTIFWETMCAGIRWRFLEGTASSSPASFSYCCSQHAFLHFKELNDVLLFLRMPLMLRDQSE